MLQALFINNKIGVPLGITSFDRCFKYGASKDTKYTNKTNKQMNDDNNQLQMDLWNQQKEYDYKMWQENNAYNTPQAQVQRLKDAGINPALALGNISTGESSSTAGGQSIPVTHASRNENPAQEVAMKVQNLALLGKQFVDISKEHEETRALQMQNNWQNVEKSAQVAGMLNDNKLKEQAIQNASLNNQLFRDTYSARQMQIEEDSTNAWKLGLNLSAQGHLTELQKDAQDFTNKHILPQQVRNMRATYGNIVADSFAKVLGAKTQAALAKSQIKLNDKQVEAIAQNIKKSCAETYGQDFVNRFNDATWESQVRKVAADGVNASMQPFWNAFSAAGSFVPLLK